MTSADEPPAPIFAVDRSPGLRLLIPITVAIGFAMEQLDTTIITTAIPAMARTLHATPLAMSLAVTTYVLVLAVFIPVSGWFADRFSTRLVFVAALITFTIGSILCGFAVNLPMLIASRALQGLGGAMMTPVGRLILLRSFPRAELVTAMTYMTLPAIVGPMMGPLLGGALTTYASWRWAFFINVPVGVLGAVLALRFVQKDERAEAPARFDFRGFILVGVAVAVLQFGLEAVGRGAAGVWVLAPVVAGAAALFGGFWLHARRTAAPAIDLTLFRDRAFRVGTLVGGVCRIGLNGTPFLLPLMLQVGFGVSPVTSGLMTFVASAGALIVRPVLSRLLRTIGFGWMLIASALFGAAATAGFAILGASTPHVLVAAYVFLFGLIRSVQFMGSNTLAYADLPPEKLSRATSLGGMLQQLSVSFGVTLAATLLGIVAGPQHLLTADRFHVAFLLMALVPLLSIPGFFALRAEDGAVVSGRKAARV
jgi:EmrB/QacA subfamily drug resistance transporter